MMHRLLAVVMTLTWLSLAGCFSKSKAPDDSRVVRAVSNPIQPRSEQVKYLESELIGRREREQYYKARPYMVTNAEKVEFLRLKTYADRDEWLERKGYIGTVIKYPTDVQGLIDRNDVAIGMTKSAVRESWGEPDYTEVAGNPIYGNENWYYKEQISSGEGYRTVNRTIYFDEGLVVGWESK